MNKKTRLEWRLDVLVERLHKIKLLSEIAFLKRQITESEYNTLCERADDCEQFVKKINTAGSIDDKEMAKLDRIAEDKARHSNR